MLEYIAKMYRRMVDMAILFRLSKIYAMIESSKMWKGHASVPSVNFDSAEFSNPSPVESIGRLAES